MNGGIGARTVPLMGTLVTIQIVGHDPSPAVLAAREQALDAAFQWFVRVEACCSRFDPASEVRQLESRAGEPVAASELLFRVVEFACALAAETDGAFDPTLGNRLVALGFNRHYQTRATGGDAPEGGDLATYRDLELDAERRTIRLGRPLRLDLGAVAKGLAIDLAARELATVGDFAIDAGGDLFLGGRNPAGEPWSVGVQHPREAGVVLGTLRVTNQAVCTSGDYERVAPDGVTHHLIDPRTGQSADRAASVTVVASTALVADGLSTAAFVLGPRAGAELLERAGVEGVLIGTDLTITVTPGLRDAFLSNA